MNSLSQPFQSEIQDHVRLVKDGSREVNHEIALAKAQADYQEHQLQIKERYLASNHRLALPSFVSKTGTDIEETKRWRAMLDRRKKGKNIGNPCDHS